MSRLIVKNLPKKSTEAKLRGVFGAYGSVTDCSLKYNRAGVFRRFAYVGFSTESEAQAALDSLNSTYIDTSKIQVEVAKDLSHSLSNEVEKKHKKEPKAVDKQENLPQSSFVADEILGNLEEDEGFQEFLDIHKASSAKTSWKNDDEAVNSKLADASKRVLPAGPQKAVKSAGYAFEGDSDSSDEETAAENTESKEEECTEALIDASNDLAENKALSDLDYLRKKASKGSHLSDDDEEVIVPGKASAEEAAGETSKSKKRKRKKKPAFVVKLRNLPFNVNKTMIQGFFQGITIRSVDIPRGDKKSTIGVAYVHFRTQSDMDAALRRTRSTMANKKVSVAKALDKDLLATKDNTGKREDVKPSWEIKSSLIDVDPIADSGRLFVRNLVYSCTESDLEQLFSSFGTLAEVELPIDSSTKRIKGFAHITYMFPEHAVLAYNKLDGTTFKGRVLHLLPGRPARDDACEFDEHGVSFKEKKDRAKKASAQSSHNWNSLFLGADAVANVMSSKYGIDKSQLLDAESSQSLGVRMALGETEIVNETRDFLLENGVSLDSFSQASAPRSKNVILVKNLPKHTSPNELTDLFTPFGILGRVVIPPAGISALIEFQEQQEAKAAFTKLAYKRFNQSPLYLEWAPVSVFHGGDKPEEEPTQEVDEVADVPKATVEVPAETEMKQEPAKAAEEEESSDDDDISGEGCTLFVKNLNFETTEAALKKHFKSCGKVVTATVATKRDPRKPGKALSMGYGFVQFKSPSMVQTALKELQHSKLDNHTLELKLSERTSNRPATADRKKQDSGKKQMSTKILVRNIPFQANRKEITELFKVFGELKLVRLPKKVGGQHRGFAFVDFITKNDAKRAFNALCHSTHLYGRRLVLEWADTAEESVDNLRKKTADSYTSERKKFKRADMQVTLEEMDAKDDDD